MTKRSHARGSHSRLIRSAILPLLLLLLSPLTATHRSLAYGQTDAASVSGRVTDQTNAVVPDVEVEIKNVDTGVAQVTKTNGDGLYSFPFVRPGNYLMNVRKAAFRTVSLTGITVHVQDEVSRNFVLQVGSSAESVTVQANGVNINTTDAAVSTVVDRQFVENMPLNGRSFQSLLTLVPGVTAAAGAGVGYSGEITVNGQRTEANYFTVDGVSVNTGTYAQGNYISGAGFSGSVPGETILGTTQSLVSIDALQEFRATTSTYSAEYGRTPGGQFSFSTRGGTSQWHGTAFDYFRNDVLDANNWFNNAANPQVPRLPERQNDFGGTLGGPFVIPRLYDGKDKTFFFFSYEGLRLLTPQPVAQYSVPDATLRLQAPAALQPFLRAFPLPNGGEDGLNDGLGLYNLAYSSRSSIDNLGIRIDHSIGAKLRLFGRYANTPSTVWSYNSPAFTSNASISVRSITTGATLVVNPRQTNDLRLNFTQNDMHLTSNSTNFGGAVPISLGQFPGLNGSSVSPTGSSISLCLCFGGSANEGIGSNRNQQRQFNLVDKYSWNLGAHQLSFGGDWRRLATEIISPNPAESGYFYSETSLLANSVDNAGDSLFLAKPVEPLYQNFSTYVQDEWRVTARLAASVGLRWEVNPSPTDLKGPNPYTVDQLTNILTTNVAPAGTPLWKTDWHAFAPRFGIAYRLRQTPDHETVVRTGFGVFYDTGNTLGSEGFTGIGFASFSQYSGVSFPLTAQQLVVQPPSLALVGYQSVWGYGPNFSLPYTMQWNLAVEQGLGANQVLTVNYVGSAGRKLISWLEYSPGSLGNPNFGPTALLEQVSNRVSSSYNALQLKYQKGLGHGGLPPESAGWIIRNSHSVSPGFVGQRRAA